MSVCGRRAGRRRLCLSKRDWESGRFPLLTGGNLEEGGSFYPTPTLPVNGLLHDTFLRENRKGAHTGVRPYQIALPVGADPRVCPSQ